MKFLVSKASEDEYMGVVEINSLEELIKFKNKYGSLVLTENCFLSEYDGEGFDYEIIIYDDYLE